MLVVSIGVIDVVTGYEIALSLFYLLPVFAVTWFAGGRSGLAIAIASATIWYFADVGAGHQHSHPAIHVWNAGIRLGFFVVGMTLMARLRAALLRAEELAQRDHLTGAVNGRRFLDAARSEIERARRYKHPLSLAYVDLDNFKTVNDQFGHGQGDEVLRIVARTASSQLRVTDIIARLGGDEFAILLPETGVDAARTALTKIQRVVQQEMTKNGWPVTLSIGIATCLEMPANVDAMMKLADDTMYDVKKTKKNAIGSTVFPRIVDGASGTLAGTIEMQFERDQKRRFQQREGAEMHAARWCSLTRGASGAPRPGRATRRVRRGRRSRRRTHRVLR
jgi:diguanylate cyclase (GGDEF)-like protein